MSRASQVCAESGCPNLRPCPTHHREPWSGSTRRDRLPANWPKLRAQVRKRDRGICRTCGGRAVPGEVDHIVPGDDHSLANLQLLCDRCHRAKSAAEGVAARRRGGGVPLAAEASQAHRWVQQFFCRTEPRTMYRTG